MKKKAHSKNCGSSESDTMLLVMKELNFNEQPQNLEILTLAHPADDDDNNNKKKKKAAALFIWNSNDGTIQELQKFSQSYRSWFIGNSVEADSKIYLSTPVDPLFLVLPYLYGAKMRSTLDQLIDDENFKDSKKLEYILDDEQLSLVADRKNCQDLIVWKYNEEKTLQWLNGKVNRVADVLKEKGIHVGTSAAVSNTYVKSIKYQESRENYMRYAYGIVAEYLSQGIRENLLTSLNLPPLETNTKKRKNTELDQEEIKKLKKECAEKELHAKLVSEESKPEKNPRKKATQTALAKAASGTKSISSFFKKK